MRKKITKHNCFYEFSLAVVLPPAQYDPILSRHEPEVEKEHDYILQDFRMVKYKAIRKHMIPLEIRKRI